MTQKWVPLKKYGLSVGSTGEKYVERLTMNVTVTLNRIPCLGVDPGLCEAKLYEMWLNSINAIVTAFNSSSSLVASWNSLASCIVYWYAQPGHLSRASLQNCHLHYLFWVGLLWPLPYASYKGVCSVLVRTLILFRPAPCLVLEAFSSQREGLGGVIDF